MHNFTRSSFSLALSLSLVGMVAGCTLDGGLPLGEACETSDQCGDDAACFEDEDGDATCGCINLSMHDGGDGTCVSQGRCVAGFHNGGDRTCVPEGECSAGVTLQGDDCFAAAAPECLQYLDCIAHFDDINGSSTNGVEEAYGNGGTCWENIEVAESCTAACESAVTALHDSLDAAGEPIGPCD